MTSFIRHSMALAFSCCMLASQAQASEAAPDGTVSTHIRVRTGDFDLTSMRDGDVLESRVRRAARQVCTIRVGEQLLGLSSRCYRRALEDANVQISLLTGRSDQGGTPLRRLATPPHKATG